MIMTDKILFDFKKRLRELVARKIEEGMTQKQIADEIGIGEGALSLYLQKNNRLPHATALLMIADYFGITVDNLLGRALGKTADNEEIHRRLGLSDEAITRLEEFCSDPQRWGEIALDAIDMLIADPIGYEVLIAIDNFVYANFDAVYPVRRNSLVEVSDPLARLAVATKYAGGPVNVRFDAELLRAAFLRDVTLGLEVLRRKVEESYVDIQSMERENNEQAR